MAADAFGIEIPADSDAFDPSGDMRDMSASLHLRIVVPVVNATARDALTVATGQLVNRLDTGHLERWDGARWVVETPQVLGGDTPSKFVSSSNPPVTVPVVFSRPFASPPSVICNVIDISSGGAGAVANDITSTGFNLVIYRTATSGNHIAHWQATARQP